MNMRTALHPPRLMTVADMQRLRCFPATHTHLARYQVAHDAGAKHVLDEPCPECGSGPNVACTRGS